LITLQITPAALQQGKKNHIKILKHIALCGSFENPVSETLVLKIHSFYK